MYGCCAAVVVSPEAQSAKGTHRDPSLERQCQQLSAGKVGKLQLPCSSGPVSGNKNNKYLILLCFLFHWCLEKQP